MDAVWVVIRGTGEYSDRIETPIRAFGSPAEAHAFAAACEAHVAAYPTFKSGHDWQEWCLAGAAHMGDGPDPGGAAGVDASEYWVEAVPFGPRPPGATETR